MANGFKLSMRQSLAIRAKYKGCAINDMEAYLECRQHIQAGFHVSHYANLKVYYRRAFLAAPFRKVQK